MTNNGPENKPAKKASPHPLGANEETHKFLKAMRRPNASGWGDQSLASLQAPDETGATDERRVRAYDGLTNEMELLKKKSGTKKAGEARSSKDPNVS